MKSVKNKKLFSIKESVMFLFGNLKGGVYESSLYCNSTGLKGTIIAQVILGL